MTQKNYKTETNSNKIKFKKEGKKNPGDCGFVMRSNKYYSGTE